MERSLGFFLSLSFVMAFWNTKAVRISHVSDIEEKRSASLESARSASRSINRYQPWLTHLNHLKDWSHNRGNKCSVRNLLQRKGDYGNIQS